MLLIRIVSINFNINYLIGNLGIGLCYVNIVLMVYVIISVMLI